MTTPKANGVLAVLDDAAHALHQSGTRSERNALLRACAAVAELRDAMRDLAWIVEAAIIVGTWKIDGVCDPDAEIKRARAALANFDNLASTKQEPQT